MPTYPTKTCKFYSCIINLQDNQLSIGDELIIAVGNQTNNIICEQTHLDILLSGQSISQNYCNISYDSSTHVLKVESLLPDKHLLDCIFRRSITHKTYDFTIANKVPYQLSLDLTNKNINVFKNLNGKSYKLTCLKNFRILI